MTKEIGIIKENLKQYSTEPDWYSKKESPLTTELYFESSDEDVVGADWENLHIYIGNTGFTINYSVDRKNHSEEWSGAFIPEGFEGTPDGRDTKDVRNSLLYCLAIDELVNFTKKHGLGIEKLFLETNERMLDFRNRVFGEIDPALINMEPDREPDYEDDIPHSLNLRLLVDLSETEAYKNSSIYKNAARARERYANRRYLIGHPRPILLSLS